MKRIFLVLMASVLFFTAFSSSAYCEENSIKTYNLTLADAISMGISDNPKLISLDIANKSHKINLEAAKITKRQYKDIVVSASAYDVMYVKKGYYVDTYEMLIRLNEREKIKAEETIKYNITESYYNYKLSQELVYVTEQAYNLATQNLSSMEKRYELGMIAKIDYETALLSTQSLKNTLDSYKRNSEIAKENLKINLGISEDCILNLTDGIECEEFSADIGEDLKNAENNRYDIMALKESYNLAGKYFDYTKALSPDSHNYQTAYSDFITKEYDYNNNKKLILLSVKNSYNNVLNSKEALETSKKSRDISEMKYNINKVKFESGMITNSELTASLNEYLNENISYENAKLKYKLAVEKYKKEILIGL